MPQDTPATDAGTESVSPIDQLVDLCIEHRLALPHDGILQLARRIKRDRVPDSWAPVNRRQMRDDVDRFRNLQMPVPQTLTGAIELAALALEYYEHAHEVATRTAIAIDTYNDESLRVPPQPGERTGADVVMARATYDYAAILSRKNLEATKELDVAGRRLETALAYLNSFKGE